MKKYVKVFSVFVILSFILLGNTNNAIAQTSGGGSGGGGGSSLPAGCTSTRGYSPTTGVKCDTVIDSSLPVGCTSTRGYSPLTGVKCDTLVNSSLPAGCTSTAGYSPLTGVKCDSNTTNTCSSSGYDTRTGERCGCPPGYVFSILTGEPCFNPIINSISPTSVPAGGLVTVSGSYLAHAHIIMDDGILITPVTRASFADVILEFLVPYNISPGVHTIWAQNPGSGMPFSNSVNLIVTSAKYPPGCTSFSGYSSTTGESCDGSTSQSPVISEVSGPQSLSVNQTGTWTVKASNSGKGNLSYSVVWGDENYAIPTMGSAASSISVQQSATFTHSYARAGTYTPTFFVTNERGQSAKASLSVKVGESTNITVISPNGGETWIKGTTQIIKWQDNSTSVCPVEGPCDSVLKYYDIKLATYYPPCTGNVCPAYPYREPYTIMKNVRGFSYGWSVGKNLNTYPNTAPDGAYTVQVCQTATNTCDSSDSYFKIESVATTNSFPQFLSFPAIPASIQPGQSVIFSLTATDKDNDNLSWSVDWGDRTGESGACEVNAPQSGTNQNFSAKHSWASSGVYTVQFTVSDCKGGNNETSFRVNVLGNTTTAPTVTLTPFSSTITRSESVPLKITFMNAESCNITSNVDMNIPITTVTKNWTIYVQPKVTSAYTVVCTNSAGQKATASAEVWVKGDKNNPPSGYTFCAEENERCQFSGTYGTRKVAFGAYGQYTYKSFTSAFSDVSCTSTNFNDPLFGVKKQCYYETSPTSSGSNTTPSNTVSPNIYTLSTTRGKVGDIITANGTGLTGTNSIELWKNGSLVATISSSSITSVTDRSVTFILNVPTSVAGDTYLINAVTPNGRSSDTAFYLERSSTSSSGSASANVASVIGSTYMYGNVLGTGPFYFTQFLEQGSSGVEVVELQKLLNGAGYNAGNVDGKFGLKTKEALIKFQTAKGLKSDGIVGYEVRSFLNK